MKISTLIKREPFEKIFENTISSFLSDINGKPYSVNWKKIKSKQTESQSHQIWFCNPLINSIFVKDVNINVFKSINGEYQFNPIRPWKSIFQKIYLIFAESRLFRIVFSRYLIEISPNVKDSTTKLIIGGNKKIRIIDIKNKEVYVILKNGFDKKYIDKELYARENFKYLDIPKIFDTGNKAIWYSEEYITGVSPNRLDFNTGLKSLNKAVNGIHRMLNSTKFDQCLSEYLLKLEKRVFDGLKQIKYLDKKEKIIDLVKKLSNELKKYSENTISIAYCHGDFHQGNILSGGDRNWILDWENSGQKQIGYDLLILLIQSRISNGFFLRFSKLINNEFDSFQWNLINNWPNFNWQIKESKKISLLLFLFEEIDFHVTENMNPMFYNNPKIFNDQYIEWEKCFNSIIN